MGFDARLASPRRLPSTSDLLPASRTTADQWFQTDRNAGLCSVVTTVPDAPTHPGTPTAGPSGRLAGPSDLSVTTCWPAEGFAESGVQCGSKRLHGYCAVGMRSGSPAPRMRGYYTTPLSMPEAQVMQRATNRAPSQPRRGRHRRSAQQVHRCRFRARNATRGLASTSERPRVTTARPLRQSSGIVPRI